MKNLTVIALAGLIGGAATTTTLHAQVWFDDFADGSIRDRCPVPWVVLPAFPGDYDASSGDLHLLPDGKGAQPPPECPCFLATAGVPILFGNCSIRAQFSFDGGSAGLIYGDTGKLDAYVGRINSANQIAIGRFDSGAEPGVLLAAAPSPVPIGTDVLMQLDITDGVIELTVWLPDEDMPDPQLTVFDETYTTGVAGVHHVKWEDAGFATFRFAQADGDVIDDMTGFCAGDIDQDGAVTFADLLEVITSWGPCGIPCVTDLTCNGSVGFDDLLVVLTTWGPCDLKLP